MSIPDLDDVSHDVITDYLRNERWTSRSLWELVAQLIMSSERREGNTGLLRRSLPTPQSTGVTA